MSCNLLQKKQFTRMQFQHRGNAIAIAKIDWMPCNSPYNDDFRCNSMRFPFALLLKSNFNTIYDTIPVFGFLFGLPSEDLHRQICLFILPWLQKKWKLVPLAQRNENLLCLGRRNHFGKSVLFDWKFAQWLNDNQLTSKYWMRFYLWKLIGKILSFSWQFSTI